MIPARIIDRQDIYVQMTPQQYVRFRWRSYDIIKVFSGVDMLATTDMSSVLDWSIFNKYSAYTLTTVDELGVELPFEKTLLVDVQHKNT